MKKLIALLSVLLIANPVLAFNTVKKATVYNPKTMEVKIVTVGDKHAFDGGFILLPSKKLGSYNPSTGYSVKTTSYIGNTTATIPVNTTKDVDGYSLSCSVTNKCYFNIEPGVTDRQERIVCTGQTSTSLTGCTRGLVATGGSETGSTTLAHIHNAGSAVIMTNISQFYNNYVDIWTNQDIAGVKNFYSLPTSTTTAPTSPNQLITLYQFQQATTTGGVNGSETVKGLWQGASRSQMSSGAGVGSSGGNLNVQSQYATSSSDMATTSVVVTGTDGKINPNFYQSNQNTWSATNTFSGSLIGAKIINSYTASTTITGSAKPQPVYLATSTGAIQLSSASSTGNFPFSANFIGFAVSSASNGGTVYVQTSGIVDNFSGLTIGSEYYVQNASGTIGVSKGTYPMMIGRAVSASRLLISRESRRGTPIALSNSSTYFAYVPGIVVAYGGQANAGGSVACTVNGVDTQTVTLAAGLIGTCSAPVGQYDNFTTTVSQTGGGSYTGAFIPIY